MIDHAGSPAANGGRPKLRAASPGAKWDILTAFARWHFWTFLAWQDIRQRYRGSTLGPFWTVANVGAVALGVGILYSTIFEQELQDFIPFLTSGIIVWFFIANSVSDATQAYVQAALLIRQAALPLLVFPLRVLTRNLIVLAHNLIVYVIVCVIFVNVPNPLWILPGMALLVFNVGWISVLSALLGTRYRDAVQIIQNLLTLFLFLSPIFWPPEELGDRAVVTLVNPVAHLLEVTRTPMLGGTPDPLSLLICLVMGIVGWMVALAAFVRFRQQIVHWL